MPQSRLEYSQMQGSFHFDDTAKQVNRDTNTYFTICEDVEWDFSRAFIEAMYKKYPSLEKGSISRADHPSVEEIKKEFAEFLKKDSQTHEDSSQGTEIKIGSALVDILLHNARTEGTLTTILGMQARILAHLEDRDKEEVWKEVREREKYNQSLFLENVDKIYLNGHLGLKREPKPENTLPNS